MPTDSSSGCSSDSDSSTDVTVLLILLVILEGTKKGRTQSSHLQFATQVQMLCSFCLHCATSSMLSPELPVVFPQCLNCLWRHKRL